MYINCCYFWVHVRPKNFLFLSPSVSFSMFPIKIRPRQAEKNEKASSLYRLSACSERECGREASGYGVEVCTFPVIRTCTHGRENMYVFFTSLRFYGEQESIESNPVKLGGVCLNLVPRSHYEIRGRLKRPL